MLEELIADFNRATVLHWYNPTPFHLSVQNGGGVITHSFIPKNTTIGEIEGEPMYIWDMTHYEYIIVGDEYVLDVSKQSPRSILSYIREENQTDLPNNCTIITTNDYNTGNTRFFLQSIRDIQIDEELVYFVPSDIYY